MKLATAAQSREIDFRAQKEFAIPAETLMENAGRAAAEYILNNFQNIKPGFVVVCGSGNNAGDGYVVARLLAGKKKRVSIHNAFHETELGPLAKKQFEKCKKMKIPVDRKFAPSKGAIIIDAVFGTGLSRAVEGDLAQLFEKINRSKSKVVALDCPSGLNVDTGRVMGSAVRAGVTLTFGCAKPGFFLREGASLTGSLVVLDIGFPKSVVDSVTGDHFLLSKRWVKRNLPRRKPDSNKSHFGKAVICAGSAGKWGAALLASEAAFRVGAGYVVLSSFDDVFQAIALRPECMSENLDNFAPIREGVYGVGPGLGIGEKTLSIIEKLKAAECDSVVLDADALTSMGDEILPRPAWVITPHSGELGRLLHISSQEVERDPVAAAVSAHKKFRCTVLLKGFHTIIVHKNKSLIVPTGNSALAKAGTGDVLTGFIAGLMAQGLSPVRAAAAGSYIHGLLADRWIQDGNDASSMIASDLCASVPKLLAELRKK